MCDLSDPAEFIKARPDLAEQLLYAAQHETQPSLKFLADHPELLQMPPRPINPPSMDGE